MENIIITKTPEETRQLGRDLASRLQGGENLFLVGELGAGKTSLVQGLAQGLGIQEPVKSPTYIYLQEYALPLRSTRLAHYDLYRLPDTLAEHDLHTLDLPERLADGDVITVVEWADKLPPQESRHLLIKLAEHPEGRRISVPKELKT